MSQNQPIRVLVADKDNVLRNMMVRMLNNEPDMKVVGVAYNGTAAIQLYPMVSPDVTLLDLNLPGINGVQTMKEIRKNHPEARFLMTGGYETGKDPTEVMADEVYAYWLREFTREKLVRAVRKLTGSEE